MTENNVSPAINGEIGGDTCSPRQDEDHQIHSRKSLDRETSIATCRVCHCTESDKRGDAALGFLGITPPSQQECQNEEELKPSGKRLLGDSDKSFDKGQYGVIEFVSPKGEIFICNADLEMGSYHLENKLIELGCSCKSDLALVHYACALKWFVNHGSTVCEICGKLARNIRITDFKKVVVSLKEYEALRERTASGDPNPAQVHSSLGVDPDAVAAVRRQRLSEISLWFNPHNMNNNNNNTSASLVVFEQPLTSVTEEVVVPTENPATKWAVEGTGILLATGLLTITLAWLIAPRVGKKTAKSGLHILLGGICALAVVVFFRFFVLTRIKYGPARYWAILFVFWFLVFGIWASRTHGAHTT